MSYFGKMRGLTQSPPRIGCQEMLWSWIGAFLGIATVGLMQSWFVDRLGQGLLIGSFGATAVLVYGAIRSPLAQPRNVLGGHVLSALIGVLVWQIAGDVLWFASALAVASAIVTMHATRTLHPPGGATALIAVIGGDSIHKLGYLYAVMPVGIGALMLLFIALLVNNIPQNRRYPEFWR